MAADGSLETRDSLSKAAGIVKYHVLLDKLVEHLAIEFASIWEEKRVQVVRQCFAPAGFRAYSTGLLTVYIMFGLKKRRDALALLAERIVVIFVEVYHFLEVFLASLHAQHQGRVHRARVTLRLRLYVCFCLLRLFD